MADIGADLVKSILDRLMDCAIAESRYVCCFWDIVEDIEKEKKALEESVKEEKRKGNNIRTDVTSWLKETDQLIIDTQMKKTCFFGWCPDCKWRYSKGKQLANKKEELKSGNVGISPVLPGVDYHSSQDYVSFESRKSKIEELLDALKNDSNFIIGLQGMGGTGKTTLAKEVGKKLKQLQQFDHVIDTTVSYTPDIRKIQDDIAAPLGLDFKDKNESQRFSFLWNRLTNGEKILLILDDVWNPIEFDKIGIPRKDNHNGCRIFLTTRDMKVCQSMECEKIIQLGVLTGEDAWTLFKKHARISDSSSKRLLDKGRDITKKCGGLPVAIAAIAGSLKGEESVEVWKSTLKSLQQSVPMHGVDESLVEVYKCLRYSYDNLKNEEAKKLFLLCSMFPEDEELSNETLTTFGIGAGLLGEVDGKYDEARDQVAVAIKKFVDSCLLLKGGKQSVKMHDLVREVALWIANEEIQAVNVSSKIQKLLLERRKNIKYLLCEGKGMDVFSCKFNRSKLEILKVVYMHEDEDEDEDEDAYVEVPNSFFENMTELRVLHLSLNTWRDVSLSLPQSFQSLTNIRSLILENLRLRDFSVLKYLQNLETLDLVWCPMDEFPGEIAKLEKLRVLRLRECIVENFNSIKMIEKCSLLEELYIVSTDLTFDTSAMHEKINFPAFQRYIMSDNRTAVDESLSKCVAFPKIDAIFSEVTFNHLVQTSELLHLQKIEGEWRNLIPNIVPIDRGMNDLVELYLSDSPQLLCLIDTTHIDSQKQSFFSKLIKIELHRMENFEELCNGPFPFDFLNNLQGLVISDCINLRSILFKSKLNLCYLKTIKLYKCPKLVSLFQLSTCQSLLLLEKLSVEYCEQLKNIIADERVNGESKEEIVDGENDNKSYGSMFPNLKTLLITSCPQLEYILPTLSTQVVPLLETIITRVCGELKYIFHQYQHEHASHQEGNDIILGSLKEVQFSGLPNFIDIFPKWCCSICLSGSSCKNNSMEKIESNPNKCNISPWIHMCYPRKCRRKVKSTKSTALPFVSNEPLQDSSNSLVSNFDYLRLWQRAQCLSKQPQILRNIKKIELRQFSKIKSVFILSIAPMMLETLRIEDCDELQHIIVDITDGDNNLSYVFPKLKKIIVKSCRQLEYLFGSCDDHQNHKINVDLPVLESLCLRDLPCLIGICSKNYSTTLPPLMKFVLNGCSQISIKSIGDFILSLSNTSIKELSETKHLLSLENLWVDGSKIENICCFNEIIGQEIILGWENIRLEDLPHMTYLFVGPRNSFILQNLMELTIAQCEKLEVIFTASISRCLPQLERLLIKECKELKQIIEENAENQEMSFPKLGEIVVEKCNKLTYLFPFSTSKELLQLRLLIIKEASELKEVFRCEADQKVQFPQLRLLLFVKLPIFSFSQGIELEYTDLWVQSCPNLSLTSTIESHQLERRVYRSAGRYWHILEHIVRDFEESIIQDPSNECQTTKITEDIQGELEVQATSQSELGSSEVNTNQSIAEIKHEIVEEDSSLKIPSATTSPIKWHEAHSDVMLDEQSTGEPCLMNQNQAIGLTDTTFKISQGNNCLKEIEDQSNQEDSLSKQTITTTSFMDSEKGNTSPRQLLPPIQEGVERNFEVGTTSTNVVIVASPNYGRTFFNETPMEEHSSMKEQQPLGKTDIGFEVPQGNNVMPPPNYCLEDRENQSTQEGSMSGKNTTATLLMKSEIRNTSLGTLLSPLQKAIKRNVEEGNTSANFKSITSSTRSELGPSVASKGETYPREHGDGQKAIPSVLVVPSSAQDTSEIALALTNSHDPGAEGPAILEGISCTTAEKVIACPTLEEITAAVCVEGSTKPATTQPIVEETGLVPPEVTSESTFLGMDEIKKLIEEDPLSALENLLTGKVSITQMQSSSIGILLQDLKVLLMDSNLEHLVIHQESRSKLVSLLEQLNQHQRILSSDAKDFVKNVGNFCNDYFGKHTTSQQVIKKHKQLLQSKDDLLNKLSSAKSTQAHIDNKSCTAKVQIDELSLKIDDLRKQVADTEHQIDALKLTMKMCDLEKEKLKAECTQWAQQSAQLLSALYSSEIDVQEVQHANNMAKEAFANLKSSFPTF
ncbi:uncharacterized protein LOC113851223 [Abrus precatorius]|uniref:Uncharacterized protein LOC113851223 n=1 Tax=Abrus precatorius TaxID=3816 RepID=A0A8B8K1A7_ABRPR|nr:uncharacterized protein LOC113851223 [Abrus precatorius]